MSAIPKSRTAFSDDTRAYNDQTLIESSNEISVCQKVDMSMGGTPDPSGLGLYKTTTTAYNKTTKTFTCSSAAEAAKFLEGDEVVIYSTSDTSRFSKVKNCVKSVTGSSVVVYGSVPDIDGNLIIEKNLVFRVSNLNVYRVDSYGIPRFYSAIAGLSTIEISIGEINEYEWKRSDYSFTVDNFDHKFDPFLPGGDHYTTFALREVEVFLGFTGRTGEMFIKNKLIFSGVTNLNNGISEEDERLKITAYDKSYVYNIPVSLNKFKPTVFDQDFAGKPIPVIYGDYTVSGKYIGNIPRPFIPAILWDYTITTRKSLVVLPASVLGISRGLYVEARSTSETYDGYQVEVLYSNEEQVAAYTPVCVETSLPGSKAKFTVTCYRGKRTNGKLFCSSEWIGLCLISNTNFNSKFVVSNATAEPVLYYKNLVLPARDYTGEIAETRVFYTFGGASVKKAFFKICSNGLSTDTSGYGIWFNKGSYDDQAAWEANTNRIGGTNVTVDWDPSNGQVIVTMPGGWVDSDISKYKAYVWVKGPTLSTSIQTDTDLLLNYGNNSQVIATVNGMNFTEQDSSGNGSVGKYLGKAAPHESSFPLGGSKTIYPYVDLTRTVKRRICKTFLGIEIDCWYDTTYSLQKDWAAIYYTHKRTTGIHAKSFIYEMELNDRQSEYATTYASDFPGKSLRAFNASTRYLAAFGEDTGAAKTNYFTIYLDKDGYITVNYGGLITKASSLNIDEFNPKIYGIKVVKDISAGNKIRIYVKKITDAVGYSEVSYSAQPTLTDSVPALNYLIVGNSSVDPSYSSGGFFGDVGMVRFRMNQTTFKHESYTRYGVVQDNNDIVQIAKQILKMGGVTDDLFDTTWDNFFRSKVSQQYSVRCYMNDTEIKTVDYAVELLGQVGLVLTMKEDQGKIKFSLIWDTLDFYKSTGKRITSYDIELGSVQVDRELNQYFNTANAKYNYDPTNDDLAYSINDYYEPAAVLRDGNLNIWFSREDKGYGSFEFPNLYLFNDVLTAMKYKIANSTANAEKIFLKLSFRFLDLKIGEFVILNHGRYVNVPCQVRELKIDANGSFVEVTLRSLESIQFIDTDRNVTYTPVNFDGVGGIQAIANIVERTDPGDV